MNYSSYCVGPEILVLMNGIRCPDVDCLFLSGCRIISTMNSIGLGLKTIKILYTRTSMKAMVVYYNLGIQ